MNTLPRRQLLLPVLLVACTQLACPTVTIKSLEVLSRSRDLVTIGAVIEVDNSEAYTDAVSSTFAIAAPAGWTVEEVRYQIPGESLIRRARVATGVAAQADWTYVQPGSSWWGFQTAEHRLLTGIATYTAQIDVRVPRKAREGALVLMVGEPGTEAAVAAYRVVVKPKLAVTPGESPGINPAALVEPVLGAEGDLGWMFGEGGEGLEAFGKGLGELGDGLDMLGSLLGAAGEPGHREEWMQPHLNEGRLQLPGISVALPDDISVMGEPPSEDRVQLVLFPPGAVYLGGLDIHLAVDEARAHELYDREVRTAMDDLTVAGTPPSVEQHPVVSASGARIRTAELDCTEAGKTTRTTLMARIEGGKMVIGAVFGDTSGQGAEALLSILDTVVVE